MDNKLIGNENNIVFYTMKKIMLELKLFYKMKMFGLI